MRLVSPKDSFVSSVFLYVFAPPKVFTDYCFPQSRLPRPSSPHLENHLISPPFFQLNTRCLPSMSVFHFFKFPFLIMSSSRWRLPPNLDRHSPVVHPPKISHPPPPPVRSPPADATCKPLSIFLPLFSTLSTMGLNKPSPWSGRLLHLIFFPYLIFRSSFVPAFNLKSDEFTKF